MASGEEAMAYLRGAVERAMKVQEVILRAIDGKLTWGQAADILGYSPRTIRRIASCPRSTPSSAGRRPTPPPPLSPSGASDLDQILCVEEERTVGRDNVVTTERLPLQLAKQPGRRTCAGLRVLVRRHLSGQHSIWYGGRCLGRYDSTGRPLRAA
jgi:hypothetical protein